MKFAAGLVLLASATAVLAGPNPEPQPADLCEMCTQVVEQLKDNDTVAQVEETMDKACDLVPHFMFQPCKDFVDQLKHQIEEVVEQDPKETCKQIGLCEPEPEPTPQPTNGFACEACKWGWDTIEKSAPPVDQVKSQLETMCGMVPPELKDQCTQAVTQIVDQYKEGLKLTPQDACSQLQLCDPEPQPTTTITTITPTTTPAVKNAILGYMQKAASRVKLQPIDKN